MAICYEVILMNSFCVCIKIRKWNSRFLINNKMLLFICMLLTWFTAITYCDVSDYGAYCADYYRLMKSGSAVLTRNYERGFYWAMFLFARLHFSFEVFFGVYMSIILYLLGKFINLNAKHKAFIWILCLFYPYLYYLQQIRSAMATMIVIYALNNLANFKETAVKRAIKYILWCLFASLFQITSLFYLMFLLVLFIEKNGLKKLVLCLNVLVPGTLYFLYPVIVEGLKILFHDFWMIDYYFRSKFTPQKYTFFLIGIYLILFCVLLYIDRKNLTTQQTSNKCLLYYKLSIIVCALAPISYFSVSAERIMGMAMPVVYIAIDMYSTRFITFKGKIARLACLVFAVFYFVFSVGPWFPQSNYRFFHEMWKQRPDKDSITLIDRRVIQ